MLIDEELDNKATHLERTVDEIATVLGALFNRTRERITEFYSTTLKNERSGEQNKESKPPLS